MKTVSECADVVGRSGLLRRPLVLVVLSLLLLELKLLEAQPARAQVVQDTADTVEALYMGAGPLTPTDGFPACPFINFWSGFPRGTTVTVRVSTTVSEDVRLAIQQVLQQVPTATTGAIDTTFETTADPNPLPGTNEVTLTFHPDPVSQGCPFARGCIMHGFASPGVSCLAAPCSRRVCR